MLERQQDTPDLSINVLEYSLDWLPSLSVWKFRNNELENWCHTQFCAVDVDRQALICFFFCSHH